MAREIKGQKMKIKKSLIAIAIIGSLTCVVASDTVATYEDPSGVSMDLGDDGMWTRIRSIGKATYDLDDQDEIEDAMAEAKMSAKADIAKFMNETITSDETVNKITKKLKEGNKTSVKVSKTTIKTMTKKIHNSASALLKGVLTLEEKVDAETKSVAVMVGLSRKTMQNADNLRNSIARDMDPNKQTGNGSNGGNTINSSTHRSKNYDNF